MITIVDYQMGNLHSVKRAFNRLGVEVRIATKPSEILSAKKLILPGVGHFGKAMGHLKETGLHEALNEAVLVKKTLVLGICLGMQLMTKHSEEGDCNGFGWIDATTRKFQVSGSLKVPHMGWNYIKIQKENPLIEMESKSRFYFVHSYHVKCKDESQSIATSDFGIDFTCMINKDNIYGAQFHPEKSLKFGMQVLENFAKL